MINFDDLAAAYKLDLPGDLIGVCFAQGASRG
jgi:hypothetical protein